jgi:hypothetical protein
MNFYDYWNEEEDEGSYEPTELPFVDINAVAEIAKFFIDADRKEARMYSEVENALEDLQWQYGTDLSIALMNYVQRIEGWDLEIITERSDVDNYLLNALSIYDENMFLKVIGTRAMSEFRREIYQLSQKYLPIAVAEILGKEQSSIFPEADPQD